MRTFTDEELLEEARPLSDRALEALEKGQIERLHYFLNEMGAGHKELCALVHHWLARMWGKIRSDLGESALDRMLGGMASYLMEPYQEEFRRGDEKGFVSQVLLIWKSRPGSSLRWACPKSGHGAEIEH